MRKTKAMGWVSGIGGMLLSIGSSYAEDARMFVLPRQAVGVEGMALVGPPPPVVQPSPCVFGMPGCPSPLPSVEPSIVPSVVPPIVPPNTCPNPPCGPGNPGNPGTGTDTSSIRNTTLRLRFSCFGTNLRYVSNPISPYGQISSTLIFADGSRLNFSVPSSVTGTSAAAQFDQLTPKQIDQFTAVETSQAFTVLRAKFAALSSITKMYPIGLLRSPPHFLQSPALTEYMTQIDSASVRGQAIQDFRELGMRPVTDLTFKTSTGQTVPGTVSGDIMANEVTLSIPNVMLREIRSADGSLSVEQSANLLQGWSFSQLGVSYWGAFYGYTGVLSTVGPVPEVSGMGDTASYAVAFPGQEGYCGGYHSPLMLFFDGKLPTFKNTARFKMNARVAGDLFWPEAKAPGYFLAYDPRWKPGFPRAKIKVESGEQLFRNSERHATGFEHLAELDTNHDHRIDARDAAFPELRLWRDLNGDAKTQSNEVFTLEELGVLAIRLDYNPGGTLTFGERAMIQGTSAFEFRKQGALNQGIVYDVWFGPSATVPPKK